MADIVANVFNSFWRYLDLWLGSTELRVRMRTSGRSTKKLLTFRLCQRFRRSKKGFFLLFAESSCSDDQIRQEVIFFVEKAGRDV